jgi:excisionase family DNA binding protein
VAKRPTQETDLPLVMTVEEVAELLQLSRETIYTEAQQGRLPARKVGRAWRFFRPAVFEYLYGRDQTGDQTEPAPGDAT